MLSVGVSQSVQFSRSVVSDSLPPRESQHARPPCPSPTPGVHSSIVYYYLIGFEGRGISNVDASYACGSIWFQMGYRPIPGIKSTVRTS